MDFTLLSHQIALLQGSAATSPLLQSPNKGIKKHILKSQLEASNAPAMSAFPDILF